MPIRSSSARAAYVLISDTLVNRKKKKKNLKSKYRSRADTFYDRFSRSWSYASRKQLAVELWRRWLTVRRGWRWWCERRVDLRVIVPGGDGERIAVVRYSGRGRGRGCGPVMVVVPGRGVSVQRAGVVMREKRVHVVGHVVGHQRLVPARRWRTGRRVVPPVMRRVMVMVVMSPGTADHFHAGSHFHSGFNWRAHGCDTRKQQHGTCSFSQTISKCEKIK